MQDQSRHLKENSWASAAQNVSNLAWKPCQVLCAMCVTPWVCRYIELIQDDNPDGYWPLQEQDGSECLDCKDAEDLEDIRPMRTPFNMRYESRYAHTILNRLDPCLPVTVVHCCRPDTLEG